MSIPEASSAASPLPRLPDPARVRRIADDAQALASAHALAAQFAAGAAERDRQRLLPWAELNLWSESGLGAITVPREYGGADVSFATLAEVFVILCAADPALGQIPQNHFGVLGVLREIGTPAQKARLYGEVLAGRRLGNAGPERRSASAATVLQGTTRLVRTPDGLRLDGQRFYSTGALFAHRVPTRATDDDGRAVQVWVPRDAPGLTVIDDWSSFGQRTTASGTVTFEQVPVDPQDVLPIWQLADRPGLFGPNSQLIQAAIDQGIAQAAVADALAFVRGHARPWVDSGLERASDDPYIIADVGRLQIDLHAAHEVLLEAGRTLDLLAAQTLDAEGSAAASVAVAEAKVLTTRIALDASEKLFELAGSASTRAAHNLDRHWRNARTHTLHDPVRWKLHLLGNYHLNHVLPARHSWN
ncbi:MULTISPECIES: SfnB family sulfur acquisition oxidoreductase [Paraburkholderia]|uniref:Dibenzothiophene desulfurization enzyme C n=1 Tax=Paraburkholderia nemoris TaxID=2793076 RepID=A0ABM8SPF4_9BURK|nr:MULTISPECIES: SfnB family sulfur acquisition oxidoreductase [Paraburkholderia]MBK5183301.1 SfnB family sulfur acquisition oxidoreductase [Burkholderia sp. R-69749]MBK3814794.1 SfnB family sulfur acquisition oxidoreductase [Paraburkholderia aspalathi]CAE6823250.1 Dibenzothiophene desulfurization enzyme C [Paraburkholderia nemoris]CAE6835836.1 Dibenzothiophene desulfurization enzyme C [Paraburkholderia nemoris]CAE6858657.1 Dibenzothiophene desulfurization enzyme C [Paraburkholderia domus]